MNRIATAAALAFLLPLIPARAATPTQGLAIGAVIVSAGNCRFDTAGPTALSFGAIDPSSLANATATANIPYRCSGGPNPNLTWSISSNDGLYETGAGAPRMRHTVNLTQYLPYSLNVPASATVPKNSNQVFVVTGTILPADFANAIAGTYTDSVVLTMLP